MRRRYSRNPVQAQGPNVAVRERLIVHSYTRSSGELVEITLNEFGWFVVRCCGKVVHSESRSKHTGAHTPGTAKTRALEYEQQDRDEYGRSVGNRLPSAP